MKNEVITSLNVDSRYDGTITHTHDWQPTPMLRVIDGEFQQLHKCVCGEQQ